MTFFNFDTESFFDDDFPIITSVDEQEDLQDELPEEIGILTLKNTVLFPGVVIPITVGRDKSIHLVKEMYAKERKLIGVVAQNNIEIETPTINDLYNCGTIARILKLIKMPDGSVTIVIQGRSKFRIEAFTGEEPYFKAKINRVPEIFPSIDQAKALMYSLKEEASRIIDLSPNLPSEAKIALDNIDSLSFLTHFIASNLNLEVPQKQEV